MFESVKKRERYSNSWMDDVATKYANKMTENKRSISWVEFWRIAYYEKLQELQSRS
jgi:hypothetical protein